MSSDASSEVEAAEPENVDEPEPPLAPLLDPAGRSAHRYRDRPGPRTSMCRPGRRNRTDRNRRRTGQRLSLLRACLSDPSAPGRCRLLPDRPDRIDQPHAASRGNEPDRVDPARRDSGPALPGGGRAASDPIVRHRTRGPSPRLSPGRVGHSHRNHPGHADAQGTLGRRLVDAPAADAVADLRCIGRRSADRVARHPA